MSYRLKISEFYRPSAEFGKRAEEIHTTKQKLMYGSEIGSAAPVKTAVRKKRRSIADMMKYAAAGIAAAGVITVAASSVPQVTEQPATPPVLAKYDDYREKYQYAISCPTYRETLTEGGYAVCLDVSTEEKKQALYDFFASSIYEALRYESEKGEEFNNDPDPRKMLWIYFLSETEDGGIIGSVGSNSSNPGPYEDYISLNFAHASGVAIGYSGVDTRIQDFYYGEDNIGIVLYPSFSGELPYFLGIESLSAAKELYGNKSKEEILGLITEPLDKYFFEIQKAADGARWTNLHYETMHTLGQFSINKGKADLIMPEFFKVIRDDEIYGYKTLTAAANTDYFLVTGSDRYPSDKPYEYDIDCRSLESIVNSRYTGAYFTYDWAAGSQQILYPTTFHGHKNVTYADKFFGLMALTDFIYDNDPDKPQDPEAADTEHIYYDLLTLNAAEDTEINVPQLSRLLPIEDKYYLYKLGYSGMYTIANNGDHEVVVIGNLCSENNEGPDTSKIAGRISRTDGGDTSQYFNYEPLLPGESVTVSVSSIFAGDSEAATLTMPECCTVVDSNGNVYSHTGVEADLMNGTIKED